MIYLDNAATTAINKTAADRIYSVLTENFANPSSLYGLGFEAQKILDASRVVVAKAIGCSDTEVFFTSGGTEANNLAILGAARARKAWGDEIIVSGYEHPSVLNTVKALENEGFKVCVINPAADGCIDPDEIAGKIGKQTVLAACMMVNNETGAMADISALAARIKSINKRTAVHCDYVQGFLKHQLLLDGAIDTAAISGHKVHGPKGIGAIYIRKRFNLERVVHGGNQERGVRSGTENVAGAAGFAAAVEETGDVKDNLGRITELNKSLRKRLFEIDGIEINSPQDASPYILNISMEGYRSETVLHFLEETQIYVSSGSACSKGARSHTLEAMSLPESRIDSAIRVSFCAGNTARDTEALCKRLVDALETLARTN